MGLTNSCDWLFADTSNCYRIDILRFADSYVFQVVLISRSFLIVRFYIKI